MGAAAVGVDLGSVFLAKRQLQGIADSAVLAATAGNIASNGTVSAQSIIDQSQQQNIRISELTPGKYTRDAAIAPAARFVAASVEPTAAKLTLEQQVPLYFAKLLLGRSTLTVRARATAARSDMAAFSIGTRLASLSGGVPNQLLSALAGTSLNLSVLDGQSLAAADIDLLGFADALRVRANKQGSTYAELFNTKIPVQKLVQAMSDAAPNAATQTILTSIASKVGGKNVALSDMIDLGPLGQTDVNSGDGLLKVDAFSLLRAMLAQQHGDVYQTSADVGVSGLASVKLTVAGKNGTAHSPWMTVTNAKGVVVRTGRLRIYLEVGVLAALGQVASLNIPIYVELAEAEARLSDIKCTGNAMSDGVTLAVTPSIGTVAISGINTADLDDFSRTLGTQRAVLANVLVTEIQAYANIKLGGTQPQSVHFTTSDIANNVTRTVSTNDALAGITQSLAKNVDVSVSILGITTRLGPVVNAVGAQLTLIAPVVDGLLNQVTGLLGVKLGSADVQVDRMRCGMPVLVA
jgi:uncharacterized membrane protein